MKYSKGVILGILLVLGISLVANATVQRPDILIYDGKEHAIYSYPLEQFFKVHPEARIVSEAFWTSLWRGYVATFEMRDGRLLVRDIHISVYSKGPDDGHTEFVSVMTTVFPDQMEVLADWYTGYLVVPAGEEVDRLGNDLIHANQIIYEVQAGQVIDKREMGKEEYIDFLGAQWEAFRRERECARIAHIGNERRD